MTTFLRLPEVLRRTGLNRSTCYELIAAGNFPKPVKIAPRAIAFPENEVEKWAVERLAEREAA
jgi:prophage regulatory protein